MKNVPDFILVPAKERENKIKIYYILVYETAGSTLLTY
jgi:hypothetical protein